MVINYELIAASQQYYKSQDFHIVETPWLIPRDCGEELRPSDVQENTIKGRNVNLVGSGEQSFLYQYKKGALPLGQFQTVTPCFRLGDNDNFHNQYFIKNELIKTDKVDREELLKMAQMSHRFFNLYLSDVEIISTSEGYDIMGCGIELGSYGIRSSEGFEWIYGTGCAEPRFSKIIARENGIPQERNRQG